MLGLVVATVERQLDPRWREHRPGEEPGHPDQAARTQVGDLPAAGAGGVEEVLRDPHVLARRYDLDPRPLGEQGQVLPRNIEHVAKGRRVGAEIADEAQVPWVKCGAEMQTETRITRGRRGVLEECHVSGERYAGAFAAQRSRVKPGAGEDSLRRQPLRAQERNRLAGEPGVDPPRHVPLGPRVPRFRHHLTMIWRPKAMTR